MRSYLRIECVFSGRILLQSNLCGGVPIYCVAGLFLKDVRQTDGSNGAKYSQFYWRGGVEWTEPLK
jgi:hypothetical protein